jgi:hypothetical protein
MNSKRKLLHCKANINVNRKCLRMKLIPKYAQIKIPINIEAAKKTLSQARALRIKNEIKFLYKKKQNLNIQLYHIHVHNANIWQQT